MPMPNFLVLGAARSGTTSLFRYLGQHPAIYTPQRKEPNFFAFAGTSSAGRGPQFQKMFNAAILNLDAYRALFDGVTTETRYGEASPKYLYHHTRSIENICRYSPDAKLIAILRDPTERAYSHFLLMLKDGKEPIADFGQVLAAEEIRLREDWKDSYLYARKGFYYHQLRPYFDTFPREQLRIYLHEDLQRDAAGLMRDLFQFLEVDENFPVDTRTAHNSSRLTRAPKNALWATLAIKPNRARTFIKQLLPASLRESVSRRMHAQASVTPPLRAQVRAKLVAGYREDILQLQDLIGRDLAAWLEC